MLAYYDSSTIIEHSIRKKLGGERGVKVLEVNIKPLADGIGVEVKALIYGGIETTSRFDLQPEFYLVDVHNQIDEIAESYKRILKLVNLGYRRGSIDDADPDKALSGTGLRGRW